MIDDSFTLLYLLKEAGYDRAYKDEWWWPNSGSVESLVGAILTQNSRWESVEVSLNNLKKDNFLSLEALASLSPVDIYTHIRASGFFRNKAKNIIELSKNILNSYHSFEEFRENVDRRWLLSQRGIGAESADAILNYTCYKEAFVVDSYTNRLLKAFGYEFDSYDAIQEWIIEGVYNRYNKLFPNFSRAKVYARSHGMIVEYCKENKKGHNIDISKLAI